MNITPLILQKPTISKITQNTILVLEWPTCKTKTKIGLLQVVGELSLRIFSTWKYNDFNRAQVINCYQNKTENRRKTKWR